MTTIATTITTRMISMQLIRPKAAGRKPTTVMAAGVATVTTSMIVRRNLPVSMSCPVVVCELPAWKKTRVSHQFFLNGTFIIYSYKVPNAMRPDLALDISFTSYFRGCCPPIFRDISTSNNFCSVLLIVAYTIELTNQHGVIQALHLASFAKIWTCHIGQLVTANLDYRHRVYRD
jgi:hypothetical protein